MADRRSYAWIVAQQAADPQLSKSDRTAARLKAAAARLLEKSSYNDLRVSDIAQDADVSQGTFYTYFDNRKGIVRVIFDEYFAILRAAMTSPKPAHEFGKMRESTETFVKYYRANLGLMRCLRALGEIDVEFAKLKRRLDQTWFERNTAHLSRTRLGNEMSQDDIRFAVYALGAMIEEFLYIRYQNPDPAVVRLARSESDVADKLARIWYRALYLADPEAITR